MSDRLPWTHEELDKLLPVIKSEIAEIEVEFPNARPLPLMTVEECQSYFGRLLDLASVRPLSNEECFLHGQLVFVFRMAVRAETLGKKGRFFVVSEADLTEIMARTNTQPPKAEEPK